MCCFSREVPYVSSTSIFARQAGPGRQLLAYTMTIEAHEELAMILPLPVPAGSPEEAVRFLDLSGYPGLFHDLDRAFPSLIPQAKGGFPVLRSAPAPATLKVHAVGDFEASFVPTRADFARLDPRFRLDDAVWGQLPQYDDHGFAVFQLRGLEQGWLGRLLGRDRRREFHPMALDFPTREPGRVFFPTVHVHDGRVHPQADFDHTLYVQATGAAPRTCSPDPRSDAHEYWQAGEPVNDFVRVADTRGLLDGAGRLYRVGLHGSQPNADRWVSFAG
ncbi:MAG: hypothetical protein EOO75_05245 [Myxococcales bacterium]|nr:MAG: hypothetical protein EOO75_05245 [Myxococcales bacterium]